MTCNNLFPELKFFLSWLLGLLQILRLVSREHYSWKESNYFLRLLVSLKNVLHHLLITTRQFQPTWVHVCHFLVPVEYLYPWFLFETNILLNHLDIMKYMSSLPNTRVTWDIREWDTIIFDVWFYVLIRIVYMFEKVSLYSTFMYFWPKSNSPHWVSNSLVKSINFFLANDIFINRCKVNTL